MYSSTAMPTACKHRAVQVAVAVCVIVLSSMEVDAQYCTGTAYYSQGYTAYRSRSSVYYVRCGWWKRSRCRRYRYHQEAYTAYSQYSYSYCCTGYGPLPSCPVSCGTLSNPANGWISHTGTTYGHTATYSCNTGYYRVGTNPRTCLSSGRWSGSTPICRPYCSTLSNPANGRVSYTGRTSGHRATYSCNTGYYRVGSSARTCLSSGRWSGSRPICRPVNCGTLSNPANGWVSHTGGTTYGKRAYYYCNTGYYRVGSSPRTCLYTGAWSWSAPTCRPVNCGTLSNPANGRVSHTGGTTYGQTATYSCNMGYNRVGSHTRTCQATGVWSGSAPTCQDIDECTSGTDRCHPHATCHNTEGSYTCSCNSGYTGDGFSCNNINECLNNNGSCLHTCYDLDGSYTCSCNNGYLLIGDGQTCEDVDECSNGADRCHHNATCHNSPGNYTCSCNTGYTGDGFLCTNINECLSDNGDCNHNCQDSEGSYTCSCINGYQLDNDGHTCEDVDECTRGADNCHENAICHNSPGNYTCSCNTGYTGDGFVCTNINECLTNNGGCQHNCHDSDGNYTCSCKDEYQLNSDGHTCQGAGNVSFSLRNTPYQNNSLVILEDIGEGENALLCTTELTACCRPPYTGEIIMGNWYFPNGTRVPSEVVNSTSGLQWDFYHTRDLSTILMHRKRGGVTGIYRCEIPDALGVVQTIYIEATTGPTIHYHTTTTAASAIVGPVESEHTVPLTSTHFNSPLAAGITGGLGMPTVIAAVLIVVGCVIIKRKNVPKTSGNDATPDVQKGESTNEDVIYDVPASIVKMTECDTPKKQMNLEMKENVSYENPYQIMKMTECQAYEAPSQIMKMTECPAYEVPSQITNMTECEAYGSLPNRR